ncbi:MAG: ParA family protein [Deltaproteobacteria bacterium]
MPSQSLTNTSTAKKPKIIAITNQKGGVGKTTTAINLGAALAEMGMSVCLIDMDPQGNASTGLGIGANERDKTTYDLLLEGTPLSEIALETKTKGVLIAPATTDLSSADIEMSKSDRKTVMLRDALRNSDVESMGLDVILIDCPPALGLLTLNAMIAAHSVLVPLQSEFYALEGLSQLLLTVREVRESANPDLRLEGVILTMMDSRNRLSQMVEKDVRDTLGDVVFETIVPRSVRLSEAPSYAISILEYDSKSKGSVAYRELAQEVASRLKKGGM